MPQTTEREHAYLVIGAGPAGLQAGYFLRAAGADVLILEREDGPGGFFRRYPRHRRLISINKVHTVADDPEIRLRWDWNSLLNDDAELLFPRYSREYFPNADDLVRYLEDFERGHGLGVCYGTAVTRVSRAAGGGFLVTATGPDGAAQVIRCRCLVVATGWGLPYLPPIDGIEHATGYEDMPTDPAAFEGHRVLIIGKGNSAFETASPLLGHTAMLHLASRRPLRLAWNTKHPGDVRGQHGALLDSYQFKTLHSVLDCTIDEIRPVGDRFEVSITYTHADGERAVLEYDSVLRCAGFRTDTSIFDADCRPALVRDGRMPELRPDWRSVNVPDLYFGGTIAQDRDFKGASSAFIDGFRYNLRTMVALLRERYDGVPLPCAGTVPADPKRLAEAVLDRVNWSSALWTQFEFLCDAWVGEGPDLRRYEDLPEEYAAERFADRDFVLTVSLRWGRDEYADVFAIERHPEPGRAAESAFIHPVVRRYRHGRLVSERHLLEDLLADWRRPDRHVEPLVDFLADELAQRVSRSA